MNTFQHQALSDRTFDMVDLWVGQASFVIPTGSPPRRGGGAFTLHVVGLDAQDLATTNLRPTIVVGNVSSSPLITVS